MDKVKGRYFLNWIEESKLCSWAWTKNRHKKISSIARFRYTLETLFSDETNDRFSKSRVGEILGWLEGAISTTDRRVAGKNKRSRDR